MSAPEFNLDLVHWNEIRNRLASRGFVSLPGVLNDELCKDLKNLYGDSSRFRKTINMERYQFGKGEYKYFNYPLPHIIAKLRERVYLELVTVANEWMQQVGTDTTYPLEHEEFLAACKKHGQVHPTVLILKYGEGGFNTLHQDLYGDVFFPFQLVLFLDDPGADYDGGEFVMTEQIPRAQSKAIVLHPKKGDMLIFTTNFRPVKGSRGYYRVSMKHGVSEVSRGERNTLGIIFHDAKS